MQDDATQQDLDLPAARPTLWRHALRLLPRKVPRRPDPPDFRDGDPEDVEEVDTAFYRSRYGDLSGMPDDRALRRHYLAHGRREGRFPNPRRMIRVLEGQYGALPPDFVPDLYRALHSDLAGKAEAWDLKEHYLRFGRREGRPCKPDPIGFERDYERLRASAWREGSGTEPAACLAGLLAHARILPGSWLGRFVLHDFTLLNGAWLPHPPASRMEGLWLFLAMGVERLAPISLRLRFDPAFQRANVPGGHAGLDDVDLYRRWLGEGIDRGEPGTEAEALSQLLGEDLFPTGFDEAAYRALLPERIPQPAPGRLDALRHFVTTGFSIPEVEAVRAACSARLLERIAENHLNRGDAGTAEIAYGRALEIAPHIGRLHHRRGDALLMLNRTSEATRAFVAAADAPGAILWSHFHAIRGLLEEPDGVPAALAHIRRSAPDWNGSPQWRAAAHRAIARTFDDASAQARVRYAAGRRHEADEQLTTCLDQIADLIRVVDPLPAALPVPRSGHIVIVAERDVPERDHDRITHLVRQIEDGGWTVELFGQGEAARSRAAIDGAAAVIFSRVAATPEVLHAILYARALGLPTFYEIDELLFDPALDRDPPESGEGQVIPARYADLQHGVPLIRYAMRACESGIAATPALAEAMRPLVRSGVCHVLRNGLDARTIAFLARPHAPFSESRLTVFYGSGTRAPRQDVTDLVAPALLDALARHPHVRLLVAGHLQLDDRFRPFADRVLQLGLDADVTASWEVLSGADINLAALAPGPFADAGSEVAWLEAALCGVPSIVSATRTHRDLLTDGRDAVLAETAQDWSRALSRLIAEPELRRTIGRQARAKALACHGPEAATEALRRFLPPPREQPGEAPARRTAGDRVPAPGAPVPKGKERSPSDRPRVLVVNVFFPPQTVGGATRVVRDNVDHILDHAADRFTLAVAAADRDAETPYRTRVDAYRGVPVHRIATPSEINMDWRPCNPAVREPFEALLDRFAPDLVHFHCIQRLTASVVEAVQERGIPYVVTLHDAWWISDFQFLTDADGMIRPPSSDLLTDATDRTINRIASIARRRRLKRVLDSAAAVVAVSDTFAGLYRQAGFPRTIAIPNGVPNLAPVSRRRSLNGRVRLGHIGGRSMHKGASLIEAVFRTGSFQNLTLTLVDHALSTDYVSEEIWGTTPVRVIGNVPQGSVGDLYAEMDVLLAPSLWPESFGLVTREAQAAGLWVVASDRGAIGEEIVEGINGFRISVESHEGLAAVLRRIDAKPGRFLTSPPPPAKAPRRAADQGDDLIALYDRLLRPSGDGGAFAADPAPRNSAFQYRPPPRKGRPPPAFAQSASVRGELAPPSVSAHLRLRYPECLGVSQALADTMCLHAIPDDIRCDNRVRPHSSSGSRLKLGATMREPLRSLAGSRLWKLPFEGPPSDPSLERSDPRLLPKPGCPID